MHLRATWVALRTVHDRIDAVVGQAEGYTVYSINTVRVVLPDGARHFRRVVPCAICGRDVVEHGSPVLRRADLYSPSNVMCRTCWSRR